MYRKLDNAPLVSFNLSYIDLLHVNVFICVAEVLHLSKPVSGSPFTCNSFDPAKVSLSNVPQGNVSVHTPISFSGITQ